MEKYKKDRKIGHGSYGVVYRGLNCETNEVVALKKILDIGDDGFPKSAVREIAILKQLNHENIVRLLDVVSLEGDYYIVFEYMDTDLDKLMNYSPVSNPSIIKRFLHQLLSGVNYCHEREILHRDLKPSNVLINFTTQALKVADFGLARTIHIPLMPYSDHVVTLWYKAPEILLGTQMYSTPIDIWSVGAIFAEMANNGPFFPGGSEIDQLFKIFSIMGTPTEETWPGVTSLPYFVANFPNWKPKTLQEMVPSLEPAGVDLLSKLLCLDPSRRISARDALSHAYFHSE